MSFAETFVIYCCREEKINILSDASVTMEIWKGAKEELCRHRIFYWRLKCKKGDLRGKVKKVKQFHLINLNKLNFGCKSLLIGGVLYFCVCLCHLFQTSNVSFLISLFFRNWLFNFVYINLGFVFMFSLSIALINHILDWWFWFFNLKIC